MSIRSLLVSIAILLVAAASIYTSFQLDPEVRSLVEQARGDDWKKSSQREFMGAVSKFGDWPWLMLFGGIGLVIAAKLNSREWVHILVAAMLASTLAGILANTSRLTTGRVRPDDEKKIGAGWHGPYHEGKWTIGNSKYNAFPSGHTATAFGFAGPIFLSRFGWGLLAIGAAALITCSRVMLGRHHISDVVVSIILAMLVSWFTLQWIRRHGDETWAKFLHWVRSRRKRTSS